MKQYFEVAKFIAKGLAASVVKQITGKWPKWWQEEKREHHTV